MVHRLDRRHELPPLQSLAGTMEEVTRPLALIMAFSCHSESCSEKNLPRYPSCKSLSMPVSILRRTGRLERL